MFSVALFTFNAVALQNVTIKEKPWTRAKEVCKALEYGEKSKTVAIVKNYCSKGGAIQTHCATRNVDLTLKMWQF